MKKKDFGRYKIPALVVLGFFMFTLFSSSYAWQPKPPPKSTPNSSL
ncbi:MAG: hypothetical protein ISR69_03640 [Gammaproteobacteria bacterium]|nr:hypothetical protein [Gammaproteobacteria bacterium]